MRSHRRSQAQWSATWLVILINVVVFIVQNVFDYQGMVSIYTHFGLSLEGLKHGWIWQLITFQFLHAPLSNGGIFHLLGNVFTIYVFGHVIEEVAGRANLLKLYLLSGVLGGILQLAGGLVWPAHFGHAVVGASAGAFGLVAAFGALFPHRPLWFFFLPVAIKPRALFGLVVAVSLLGMVWQGRTVGVAHGAHLGGLLTGWFFVRSRMRNLSSALESRTKPALAVNPILE
jgi:membrane associated rhomboid family serine protease